MKQKHRDKWLDRCAIELAYCYRLCVTEKEFQKELRRLKLPKNKWPPFLATDSANATCHYLDSDTGNKVAIVCLHRRERKTRPVDQIYGLLIHEAVHVWRASRLAIGELDPSSELEAYAIQRIAQNLIYSWMEQTK